MSSLKSLKNLILIEIPPENILNYDETNFRNDSGQGLGNRQKRSTKGGEG